MDMPSKPSNAQPNAPTRTHAAPSACRSAARAGAHGSATGSNFALARLVAALAAGVLAPGGHALAQTCAAPALLSANTVYMFDTCQGETQLLLACGLVPLAGPATVVKLDLTYPAGEISIQSGNAAYAPAAFLLRADCNGYAPCSAAAWVDPVGSIDLSSVESGRYYLVIAADGTSPVACGPVMVTAFLTPEQEALGLDGIFRSGTAPIWQP